MNKEVREYLIELSRQRNFRPVFYQQLCDDCGLKLNMRDNPSDRREIGAILGEISRFEYDNKRPLLSSLVIRAEDNYEGDGFYKLAEELGFGDWRLLKKRQTFEIEQMNACIDFWRDESNYKKFKQI